MFFSNDSLSCAHDMPFPKKSKTVWKIYEYNLYHKRGMRASPLDSWKYWILLPFLGHLCCKCFFNGQHFFWVLGFGYPTISPPLFWYFKQVHETKLRKAPTLAKIFLPKISRLPLPFLSYQSCWSPLLFVFLARVPVFLLEINHSLLLSEKTIT